MRITGGTFKGRELKTVRQSKAGYRPATSKVREAVFSMLMARGMEFSDARVLDVFAGSGSLGFEALSRGASQAVFLEMDRTAIRIIKDNAAMLGVADQCLVLGGDALAKLRAGPGEIPFDVVFIDPPYGRDLLEPSLSTVINQGWAADEALVVAEVEARLSPPTEESLSGLEQLADKTYGQTRIYIWKHVLLPSTPAPSTP